VPFATTERDSAISVSAAAAAHPAATVLNPGRRLPPSGLSPGERNGTVTPDGDGVAVSTTPAEILVLRAWAEPAHDSGLRVRMVRVRPGQPDRPVLTTTSVDDTCTAVRNWLIQLQQPGESGS
jgi:hypothetical protein